MTSYGGPLCSIRHHRERIWSRPRPGSRFERYTLSVLLLYSFAALINYTHRQTDEHTVSDVNKYLRKVQVLVLGTQGQGQGQGRVTLSDKTNGCTSRESLGWMSSSSSGTSICSLLHSAWTFTCSQGSRWTLARVGEGATDPRRRSISLSLSNDNRLVGVHMNTCCLAQRILYTVHDLTRWDPTDNWNAATVADTLPKILR